MTTTRYRRYVAIGDSSTEGIDDPDGTGGFRGWADRLAEKIARAQGSERPGSDGQGSDRQGTLLYANLGIRGWRTRRIREEQLGPALGLRPDLVTLFSGTNDVVARHFDLAGVANDVRHMHQALIASGATLLTFTLPDLSAVMPMARLIAPRVDALNRVLREVAAGSGAILVDFAEHPVASDPRLWSADRLHANAAGHARMAAALAHALLLPEADAAWSEPLPEPLGSSMPQRLRSEAAWARSYLLPWAWRHLRGRSAGDGIAPKRPELAPVEVAGSS